MKKVAYGNNRVFVEMTPQEFAGLAGEVASNIPDGTDISLVVIKQKLELVDNKKAELLELKGDCQSVVNKLTAIGVL